MTIALKDSNALSESQVASTLPHLRKMIADAVSDSTPLLSFLMGQLGSMLRDTSGQPGGIPGITQGGTDFRVPVQLLENTTVGSYSGADTLDITSQDTDRYALFPIKQNSGSLVITGREKRSNKGESAVYSLLESKTTRLINDLRIELNRQCVSDGTGNSGKDIVGLEAVINTGTLAGLSAATFPVWQPGRRAASDDRLAIESAFGSYVSNDAPSAMIKMFNNLTNGGDKPDAIITAQDVFQFQEQNLTDGTFGQIHYTKIDVGARGFNSLLFKGQPMLFDFAITDGTMYFLNSRHCQLQRDSEADFAWLNPNMQTPPDQDVWVRNMLVEGNIVTDNRGMLGKFTGVTA